MRILKAQMFLIICSLAVVLALVALYWPIGTSKAALQDDMQHRLSMAKTAGDLDQIPYLIPGMEQSNQRGPITDNVIKVKERLIKNIAEQADQINQLVSRDNELHRVVNGEPLLGNVPQRGYLPKLEKDKDSMEFKGLYEGIYKKWLGQLLNTSDHGNNFNVYTDGAPPAMQDVEKLIKEYEAQQVALAPRLPNGQVIQNVATQLTKHQHDEFVHDVVSAQAKKIAMYVTSDAFQIRPWAFHDNAPKEDEIFVALVDSWIQQDVVDAILAINKNSAAVETSPIKRLEMIVIGANAALAEPSASAPTNGVIGTVANAGSWYVLQGTPGTPMGMGGVDADYSKSMTGRASVARPDGRYDVAHVKVILDIDPSYLNRFIAALYQQNNGYTVLAIPRIDAVDPFEAGSKGYLYGKVPVVRVEIVLESLFFRRWTESLMPDSIKTELGIPLTKPGTPGFGR